MSDFIAVVSIISSAAVIVTNIYFNWKRLKLEEKILREKQILTFYPKIQEYMVNTVGKRVEQLPPGVDQETLNKLEGDILKFQSKWIKKHIKKLKKE